LQSRWRPDDNLPSEDEARTQARQAIKRAGVPKVQERIFLPFVFDLIRRQPKGMTQQTRIEQLIAEIHQTGGIPSWGPQEDGVSA